MLAGGCICHFSTFLGFTYDVPSTANRLHICYLAGIAGCQILTDSIEAIVVKTSLIKRINRQ